MSKKIVFASLMTCLAAQPVVAGNGVTYVVQNPQIRTVVYAATPVSRLVTHQAPVLHTYGSPVMSVPLAGYQPVSTFATQVVPAQSSYSYYGAPMIQGQPVYAYGQQQLYPYAAAASYGTVSYPYGTRTVRQVHNGFTYGSPVMSYQGTALATPGYGMIVY